VSVFETMYYADGKGVNERKPNYRDGAGGEYLVRCFACDPEHGRENWAPAVATGRCAFCGAMMGEGCPDCGGFWREVEEVSVGISCCNGWHWADGRTRVATSDGELEHA